MNQNIKREKIINIKQFIEKSIKWNILYSSVWNPSDRQTEQID